MTSQLRKIQVKDLRPGDIVAVMWEGGNKVDLEFTGATPKSREEGGVFRKVKEKDYYRPTNSILIACEEHSTETVIALAVMNSEDDVFIEV